MTTAHQEIPHQEIPHITDETARTLAESLIAPAAANARNLAKLYRKAPPQQEGLASHFAFALRSAASDVTCKLEERTDLIAQAITDPSPGPGNIVNHLDLADWDSTNCRKYVAFALEDARHAVALKGRQEAHAQALAEALFHHIQTKVESAALKDRNWEHPARWLKESRTNLVSALSTERAGYTHIQDALEIIEALNRACPE